MGIEQHNTIHRLAISIGQKIGILKLSFGGKPYTEFPLVALEAVPLANVFSRGWDIIRLLFE